VYRVGTGHDIHRFEAGRPLVLGGVRVPYGWGLAGHSDADVLTHAIMDALLGALALGDIGRHFPDTDPQWKNADSLALLARVVEMIGEQGWQVGNLDAILLAEAPRLAPYLPAMRERLASALGVEADRVSVKAGTHERMGSIGRGEGIAATAVVLLERTSSAP
jgi:2-C-methyl-D-erythritol 2,4-cyclodiphosphate synthase